MQTNFETEMLLNRMVVRRASTKHKLTQFDCDDADSSKSILVCILVSLSIFLTTVLTAGESDRIEPSVIVDRPIKPNFLKTESSIFCVMGDQVLYQPALGQAAGLNRGADLVSPHPTYLQRSSSSETSIPVEEVQSVANIDTFNVINAEHTWRLFSRTNS